MSVITDAPTQEQLELNKVLHHNNCLLCGTDNPSGFGLNFHLQNDDSVKAEYLCESHLQGYSNILHGGIISSLLDCAMVHCLFAHDIIAVTAEMNVRFKSPIHLGTPLIISANLEISQPSLYVTKAMISQNGLVKAKAIGKFMKTKRH